MIKGDKIYLRPIIREDLIAINKWRNDEDIFKYLGGGFMPISIDQQEKWLESMIDTTGNNKRFIICDETDNSLGMVGLYGINFIHRTCEIGIYIGEDNVEGKGYGKESCILIEGFASEYLNLRKIKLSVVSDNERALNMWSSLGYLKVGEYIKERFIKGKYRDLTIMEKFINR